MTKTSTSPTKKTSWKVHKKSQPVDPVWKGGGYNTTPLLSKKGKLLLRNSYTRGDVDNIVTAKAAVNGGEQEIDVLKDLSQTINPEFRIQCSAFLLTYNKSIENGGPFTEHDFDLMIEFIRSVENISHFTVGMEVGKNENVHMHVYISREKNDCSANFYAFQGVCPNVSVNRAKGNGKRSSVLRGHYYAGIAPKIGVIKQFSTLVEDESFDLMKSSWVTDLVRQGKMLPDDGVKQLFKWRNNDSYQIAKMQSLANSYVLERNQARNDSIMERARSKMKPSRIIPEIEEWKEQFVDPSELRYKFLIIVGPTRLGKSEFADRLFENPFRMKGNIVWDGFDATVNRSIVFHDVPNIFAHILERKEMFQANGIHCTGCSNTNKFVVKVNLLAMPLIIVVNRDQVPEHVNEWIVGNSITYHVNDGEKMWIEDE